MNDRTRLLRVAILTMTVVFLVGEATTVFVLYRAHFERERSWLIETVKSQASLMETVARFGPTHTEYGHSNGTKRAVLSQFVDAHSQFEGFGETGEFTLVERDGEKIVCLLSHCHGKRKDSGPIPFASPLAE